MPDGHFEKGAGNPAMTGLSHIRNSSKWSMTGRPKDMPGQKLKTPAPAHYGFISTEVTSKFAKVNAFGFGSSTRCGKDPGFGPGPGTYTQRKFTGAEGPSCSFVGRPKNAAAKPGPGPGAHNLPDLTMTSGPAYSGTAKPRDPKKPPVPAPGAYDQEGPDKLISKCQPRIVMGTSNRPPLSTGPKVPYPGPGAYSHSTPFGHESNKYSMTSRRDMPGQPKTQDMPGPGAHGGSWTQFGH